MTERCPECLAYPPCAVWIVAQTRSCQPYPCRCQPKYGGRCHYRRCDCWGRVPADHLPQTCCAWDPENPNAPRPEQRPENDLDDLRDVPGLEIVRVGRDLDTIETILDDPAGPARKMQPAIRQTRRRQAAAIERQPYERRWDPAELTCTCPTPWDGQKRAPGGIHATCCHVNCASGSIWGALHPTPGVCRDPEEFRDVDTGRQLLMVRLQGGLPVWGWAPMPVRAENAPRGYLASTGSVS